MGKHQHRHPERRGQIGGANGDKAELDNTSTGIYDIADDSGIKRGSSTAS